MIINIILNNLFNAISILLVKKTIFIIAKTLMHTCLLDLHDATTCIFLTSVVRNFNTLMLIDVTIILFFLMA